MAGTESTARHLEHGPRGRWVVRAIFITVLVLMVAQTLFIVRYGEPYPALMLPGFGGRGIGEDGVFRLSTADFIIEYADGTQRTVPVHQLMEPLPDSHHQMILILQFLPSAPHQAPARERPAWHGMFPGLSHRSRVTRSTQVPQDVRRWLADRASAMSSHGEPRRIQVQWIEEVYRFDDRGMTRERQPGQAMSIDLS